VEAAFQIPDQRPASSPAPELESWGALMSVSRPCPATPLHSRALPTAADEGRVPGRREPEHVRNGVSSRIMYPFLLGALGAWAVWTEYSRALDGSGTGTGGVCAVRLRKEGCRSGALIRAYSCPSCSYLA
jgi:hypothetical protein